VDLGDLRSTTSSLISPTPPAIEKAVGPSAVLLRKPFSLRSGDRGSCSSIRNLNSTTGDLQGVIRAMRSAPREAARTRRACGIRTP
jgi:hypothetical protein